MEVAKEVNFKALARQTAGYSGDDITGVCRDAAMNSMRRQIKGLSHEELVAMKDLVVHQPVNMEDFLQARISEPCACTLTILPSHHPTGIVSVEADTQLVVTIYGLAQLLFCNGWPSCKIP